MEVIECVILKCICNLSLLNPKNVYVVKIEVDVFYKNKWSAWKGTPFAQSAE